VPTLQALGKDFLFFFKKNSLPSANPAGTRQSLNFFLKKNSLHHQDESASKH